MFVDLFTALALGDIASANDQIISIIDKVTDEVEQTIEALRAEMRPSTSKSVKHTAEIVTRAVSQTSTPQK